MATGRLTIIDRGGERTRNVCATHKVAHKTKDCPKCVAAKKAARAELKRFEREIMKLVEQINGRSSVAS